MSLIEKFRTEGVPARPHNSVLIGALVLTVLTAASVGAGITGLVGTCDAEAQLVRGFERMCVTDRSPFWTRCAQEHDIQFNTQECARMRWFHQAANRRLPHALSSRSIVLGVVSALGVAAALAGWLVYARHRFLFGGWLSSRTLLGGLSTLLAASAAFATIGLIHLDRTLTLHLKLGEAAQEAYEHAKGMAFENEARLRIPLVREWLTDAQRNVQSRALEILSGATASASLQCPPDPTDQSVHEDTRVRVSLDLRKLLDRYANGAPPFMEQLIEHVSRSEARDDDSLVGALLDERTATSAKRHAVAELRRDAPAFADQLGQAYAELVRQSECITTIGSLVPSAQECARARDGGPGALAILLTAHDAGACAELLNVGDVESALRARLVTCGGQ